MTLSITSPTVRSTTLTGIAGLAAPLLGLAWAVQADCADEERPEVVHVTGTVRDFRERSEEGGHPDMENRPSHGFGRYSGNLAPVLGPERKPVFTGSGHKIAEQWRDSDHRALCPLLYDPERGDTEGRWADESNGGITSAETFATWFRDDPGINMSGQLILALFRDENGNYVFDDETDPYYMDLGGFFPIDDRYFGNSRHSDHNFHFTFELHLQFVYEAACDQTFKFIGDDDIWVFIDDRLVIDFGGVHAAHDQFVDLDRLNLTDGETYQMDFFFAERFRPRSNFRIETNIVFEQSGGPHTVSAQFD